MFCFFILFINRIGERMAVWYLFVIVCNTVVFTLLYIQRSDGEQNVRRLTRGREEETEPGSAAQKVKKCLDLDCTEYSNKIWRLIDRCNTNLLTLMLTELMIYYCLSLLDNKIN